jgi:hypothetical protein
MAVEESDNLYSNSLVEISTKLNNAENKMITA